MKDIPELVHLVCAGYCRFYRPGEKEELSCSGYDFFRDRVGPERLGAWVRAVDPIRPWSPAHQALSTMTLCRECVFRTEDCDFQARPRKPGAAPCGGYALLCHLLAASVEGLHELLAEEA